MRTSLFFSVDTKIRPERFQKTYTIHYQKPYICNRKILTKKDRMKTLTKTIFFSIFLAIILFSSCKKQNEIENKVDKLLSEMTLDEKVGQMTQISINYLLEGKEVYAPDLPYKLNLDSLESCIVKHNSGSIFGCARGPFTLEQWRTFNTQIQEYSAKTRLKIPVIYGVDAIHGGTFAIGSTIFPQQIGLAATWNTELVSELSEISAYECRATGVPWNFSPVLDLGRAPLWSRFFETFGEDVYLAEKMGLAVVENYQDGKFPDQYHVAACMKHFIGYSLPFSGKDRTQSFIDEKSLREIYLPTFEAAIDANALTLMVNSGEINGIPVHANKFLLTDLLRTELGFDGIVVTDFKDIILLHKSHHIAATYKEAVKIAINAGIDMSMVPLDFDFSKYLIELVNEGEVSISRIDESVKRILRTKFRLGLFENPLPNFDNYPKYGSEEFAKVSLEAALESITLLKNNENTLPFSSDAKILVCGPTSDEMRFLNGPWTYSWQGDKEIFFPETKNTIAEAMKNYGKENVECFKGSNLNENIDICKAEKLAKNADAIVVCIGELHGVEELGNINNYMLPKSQYELVEKMAATGKPIILVINSGRPQIITEIEPLCNSILTCYLPGNEGGDALAKILYGEVNPSGKLPFTWHKYPATISLYDHKYTDHNIEGEKAPFQPLYEFGHGLSYTTFSYNSLNINKTEFNTNDTLEISVTVKNSGDRFGKEVVKVFISDIYASVTPPVKRVRAFEKIGLEKGESRVVNFKIPIEELSFIGQNMKPILEAGDFIIQIENLKKDFILK